MDAQRTMWAGVSVVEPGELFRGVVLITVPHMDDEALACGGTIAKLADKQQVHLVYATDGMRAPEPILPWRDAVSPDLGAIRRQESVAAMAFLGIPESNIRFFQLPEARLERHQGRLAALLRDLIVELAPDHILTPFRYDRHRDHIAVNRAVMAATRAAGRPIQLAEYFVYHYWRLLPRRDVRRYIRASELRQVEITEVSDRKRAALECFKSQTTRFYPWQTRPNLTASLLDSVSREPELFLISNPSLPGASVFTDSVTWIRMAHRLESPLKRTKDRAVAVWQRARAR
jgi:LmbE family N-acetylglucosaminyl deacetylase